MSTPQSTNPAPEKKPSGVAPADTAVARPAAVPDVRVERFPLKKGPKPAAPPPTAPTLLRRFRPVLIGVGVAAFVLVGFGAAALSGITKSSVRDWSTQDFAELKPLKPPGGPVAGGMGLDVPPDDKDDEAPEPLRDGEVRRWRKDHHSALFRVLFSPDGRSLLCGGDNGLVRLYDVETGGLVGATVQSHYVVSLAFSADGKSALLGSEGDAREVRLWDWTAPEPRWRDSFPEFQDVVAVAFSADGKQVFCLHRLGNLGLHDAGSGERTGEFSAFDVVPLKPISAFAFAPDARRLALGTYSGDVYLREVKPEGEETVFRGHFAPVWDVALSADSRSLMSGGDDGTARIWDINTRENRFIFKGHDGPILAVALSPDRPLAVTGGVDKTVRVWDTTTGKELRRFDGHTAPVRGVAVSPDGRYAASASHKTVRLWRLPP